MFFSLSSNSTSLITVGTLCVFTTLISALPIQEQVNIVRVRDNETSQSNHMSQSIINGSCLSLDGKCHFETSNVTAISTTTTLFNSSCLTCLSITEFMVVERDIFNMTISNISKSIHFICGLFDNITLPGCSYMATFSRRVIGLDVLGMNATQICRNISMC